jgi:hypothetical protein
MKAGNYLIAVTLGLALAAPSTALAQGRGRGHAHRADTADDYHGKHDDHHAVVVDRDGYVRVIHEYASGGSLPPGLARREALPPGLRRQLRENGALPPGLQKRLVPVPLVLVRRMPPVPSSYRRYFAGDDLIVIDTRTHRIAAIVPDVWR